MVTAPMLQIIPHTALNHVQWNDALQKCSNAMIYAEAEYLTQMCEKWYAVVNEDWSAIMPIPVKKKMGIEYVPIVPFIQQLGIFYKTGISVTEQSEFASALQQFKLVNYSLNYDNKWKSALQQQKNYIIDLNIGYEDLAKNFKSDFAKYLKQQNRIDISVGSDYGKCMAMFAKSYGARMKHVTTVDYSNFEALCLHYLTQNRLKVYSAKEGEEILATAIFLFDAKRIYNIASTITAEGKKNAANHHLYNQVLKDHAGTELVLDLEGGDIPGIEHFYKIMGGAAQHYYYYEHNNLPWYVNWLRSLK
jgi:hypothetical protein